MPDYKNQLITSFVGRVDSTFSNAVKNVSSSLNGLTASTKQLGTVSTGLSKTGSASKAAAANMGLLSGATKSVVGAFTTLARFGAAGAIFGAITGAVKGTVNAIVDFDQSLKNLQAITNASNFEVAAFGDKMVEVSNNTKFSAAEVAQAMVYLGQAGFTAKEALESIDAIAAVATGTLTDFATTADLFTSTIRAFQLETKESARVADIFASSVNRSKLTIQGLRTIFNYVGASANQAGISLEETAAAAGLLANNGLRFSTVGTSMRNVISRMIAPNAKLKKELALTGLSISDINPKVVGFQQAMQNLTKVLVDQKTGIADAGKAYELFGLRGQQAANVFVRSFTSGEFDKMLTNITGVGEAFRQQLKQQEGLGVQLKNLGDRWKNLGVALGDAGLTLILRGLIDVFSELAVVLQRVVSIIPNFISYIKISMGSIKELTTAVLANANSYASVGHDLKNYIGALKSLKESGKNSWEIQEELSNIVDVLIKKYPELASEIRAYNGDIDNLIISLEGLSKQYDILSEKEISSNIVKKIDEKNLLQKKLNTLVQDLETYRNLLASADKDGPRYGQLLRTIEKLEKDIERTKRRLEDATIAVDTFSKKLSEAGEGISDGWLDRDTGLRAIADQGNAFIEMLSRLGNGWTEYFSIIRKTGSAKLLKMFSDAAKQAVTDMEEAVTTLAEADPTSSLEQRMNAGAQASKEALEELKKAIKDLTKDERRALEEAYKKQVDAITKALNAEKSAIDAREALRNRDITRVYGTERQRLDAERESLDARLAAEKKYFEQRIQALAAFEKKRIALGGEAVPEQWEALQEEQTKALQEGLEDRYKLEEKYIKDIQENPETLREAWFSALHKIKQNATTTWKQISDGVVELADAFAESTSQAFIDFVKGTKSATEAFSDMAASILEDITKMIIKQQILNLLISGANAIGFDSFASMLGGGGSGGVSNTGGKVSLNHSGGMAGKASAVKRALDPSSFIAAPKFHNGGEVNAVLQKGEVVQTREQAAANREPRNVKVVIENNTGTQIGQANATSSMDLSGEVIKIVLDGIDRNRNGLRTVVANAGRGK